MLGSTMNDTHRSVVADLRRRQPESEIGPSLARIQALVDLLGGPHRSAPVIHVTGTNGKGSTATMIDALLRAQGLRTGRYASPHLVDVTERISVDGRPVSEEVFDEAWEQIRPYVEMVDEQRIDGIAMTFFEVVTGLAFAIFADAPVDVVVLEVGMGGAWDATNVADADVAVVTPISLDHTEYLGDTLAEIAAEKAGIIKPGSVAVLAGQAPEAAQTLVARCAEVGALVEREGVDFGLVERTPAVGGQMVRLDAADGVLDDVHLPLYGAHMARNAALALAAVEAFDGGRGLSHDVVSAGLGDVVAPARTERVRTSPAVVLDTAHNPAAVRAALDAVVEAYAFAPLVAVVGMMADKDVLAALQELEGDVDTLVATQASGSRAMSAGQLAELAVSVLGEERVHVRADLAGAIETAVSLADDAGPTAGVLVIGSAALAGEARALLVTGDQETAEADESDDDLTVEDTDDQDAWDVPDEPDADRFAGREWDGR